MVDYLHCPFSLASWHSKICFFRPVHNLDSAIQSKCSTLHYPQGCYSPVNRRIPLAGHQTWSLVLLFTLPRLVGPFDQWNSWGHRLLLWHPFSSSLSGLLSNQLAFSVSSSLNFMVAAQFTSSCPLAFCLRGLPDLWWLGPSAPAPLPSGQGSLLVPKLALVAWPLA